MMTGVLFPRLTARDLDGREVALPAGLPGEWNVVILAFRRDQQELADSWVPWLKERAAAIPGLRFAELPAIGLQWQPARPVIDGGVTGPYRWYRAIGPRLSLAGHGLTFGTTTARGQQSAPGCSHPASQRPGRRALPSALKEAAEAEANRLGARTVPDQPATA